MWEHFGSTLREQVIALGTSQVRPGGLFSATAWCNIAKVVVILDNFRCACFVPCQVPVYEWLFVHILLDAVFVQSAHSQLVMQKMTIRQASL